MKCSKTPCCLFSHQKGVTFFFIKRKGIIFVEELVQSLWYLLDEFLFWFSIKYQHFSQQKLQPASQINLLLGHTNKQSSEVDMSRSGKSINSHLRIFTTSFRWKTYQFKQSFEGPLCALFQYYGSSATFTSDLINSSSFLSPEFRSHQGVCKWTVADHLSLCFFPPVDSSSKATSFQIQNLFFPYKKVFHFYSLPKNADQIQIGPAAVRLSLQMTSGVGGWQIPPQRTHSTCHSSDNVEVSLSVCLSNLSIHHSILYSNLY